ncbi:MAG TPA: TIR domain-containing protein [Croceibacterium sp.]|nr:TIR domain-containing protein [Croceibacterium sp.]
MHDVFISYARETAGVAGATAKALRDAGHSVWLDDAIPAHRPYTDVITEQLDAAKAVVVIWSAPATRSHWVRSEANRARECDKLIQLRVDEALLPMPFDQIQCVDLKGWRGDPENPGWQRILASVASLTGAAPPPVPAALHTIAAKPSVAVLALRDLSAARDQGYFCDGLVEELLMSLTRLPGLRVASPALVGHDHQLSREQLDRLGVTALLEGSVRKEGERARIAVRLVQSCDGLTLWAQTFDSMLGDVFALQERIAHEVVEALGLELFPGSRTAAHTVGTGSAAALDFYLRGKALVRRELESERRNAAELFRQAIAADPGFGQAHAALADVLTEIARQRPPDWQTAEQEALAAADRAVEIAPGLPDAHLARGGILRFGHHPDAENEFRKAVELGATDPNIHYRFARFLVLEGRKREAIQQYEEAFRLAPDDYRHVVYTLQEYQALGDAEGERSALERSWPAIERHLEINPDDVRALGHGAGVLALLGRPDDCEAFIRRALRIRPDDYGNLVTLACAAVLNRDPDRALDLLEAAVATGRGDKEWMLNDNDLKPLHGHPRFEALVARMI